MSIWYHDKEKQTLTIVSNPALPIAALAIIAVLCVLKGTGIDALSFATGQNKNMQGRVAELIGKPDPRAECAPFRAKLLEQVNGSPLNAGVQYAILNAWNSAKQASCVVE